MEKGRNFLNGYVILLGCLMSALMFLTPLFTLCDYSNSPAGYPGYGLGSDYPFTGYGRDIYYISNGRSLSGIHFFPVAVTIILFLIGIAGLIFGVVVIGTENKHVKRAFSVFVVSQWLCTVVYFISGLILTLHISNRAESYPSFNKSGYYYTLSYIPFLIGVIILIFYFRQLHRTSQKKK